jgi:hypothetical protein
MTVVRRAVLLGALVALGAKGAPAQVPLTNAGPANNVQIPPTTDTGVSQTELDSALLGGDADNGGDGGDDSGGAVVNRSVAHGQGAAVNAPGKNKAKSNPEIQLSFEGLNLFNQRFANNGNQFSVEPPDQGLCVGNGFVVEPVNDVVRIMDTAGNTLRTVDLNTFYGYPAAIDRTKSPLQFGPSITDPSCLYDPDTGRFFQVVLTLDRANPFTQALSGNNHLDIAVSDTGNALGSWTVYHLPVQNNGTQGTPDHGCPSGFCLGDYPHIGADATGFYMTTNEFDVFASGFFGAQIYAVSKRALANGTATQVFLFNTGVFTMPDGVPGFTVWPAQSPGQNTLDNGGTEYFLSSDAVFFGESSRIAVWSITNSTSLDTATPAPQLSNHYLPVIPYAIPGRSSQKNGSLPLRDCIADPICAAKIGASTAPKPQPFNPISKLDSNDSRMQQVSYANGKLWASWGTGLTFDNGVTAVAGLTYVVFEPTTSTVFQNAYIGLAGNNLTYGAVGVTKSGRGVVAFTLVGPDYFPSAGYTSLDAKIGAGDIHVAGAGVGPWDGFTGYRPFSTRPRWGDYGATAVDGDTIWIASEWVAQTCTYAQYNITGPGFGTCGNTRAPLGNWSTHISKLSTK